MEKLNVTEWTQEDYYWFYSYNDPDQVTMLT